MAIQNSRKFCNVRLHESPVNSSPVVTWIQTDRQTDRAVLSGTAQGCKHIKTKWWIKQCISAVYTTDVISAVIYILLGTVLPNH